VARNQDMGGKKERESKNSKSTAEPAISLATVSNEQHNNPAKLQLNTVLNKKLQEQQK